MIMSYAKFRLIVTVLCLITLIIIVMLVIRAQERALPYSPEDMTPQQHCAFLQGTYYENFNDTGKAVCAYLPTQSI